ncbi:hypothetical protein TRFO_14940 [Tritrichomonas foetus]|uniref:Uncharacterized protein n=1 Tax=Tritrichomonas foetus TaxID=1144522 RepID=A0A1J4KTQ8_9EUKA|nr:hypothetical protein TRFO_14940 [Tritrichomonas foetus]|eukprot:OHT14639.1 hypothetical protein TRFO_14940 [Tritrichomonas foetus]
MKHASQRRQRPRAASDLSTINEFEPVQSNFRSVPRKQKAKRASDLSLLADASFNGASPIAPSTNGAPFLDDTHFDKYISEDSDSNKNKLYLSLKDARNQLECMIKQFNNDFISYTDRISTSIESKNIISKKLRQIHYSNIFGARENSKIEIAYHNYNQEFYEQEANRVRANINTCVFFEAKINELIFSSNKSPTTENNSNENHQNETNSEENHENHENSTPKKYSVDMALFIFENIQVQPKIELFMKRSSALKAKISPFYVPPLEEDDLIGKYMDISSKIGHLMRRFCLKIADIRFPDLDVIADAIVDRKIAQIEAEHQEKQKNKLSRNKLKPKSKTDQANDMEFNIHSIRPTNSCTNIRLNLNDITNANNALALNSTSNLENVSNLLMDKENERKKYKQEAVTIMFDLAWSLKNFPILEQMKDLLKLPCLDDVIPAVLRPSFIPEKYNYMTCTQLFVSDWPYKPAVDMFWEIMVTTNPFDIARIFYDIINTIGECVLKVVNDQIDRENKKIENDEDKKKMKKHVDIDFDQLFILLLVCIFVSGLTELVLPMTYCSSFREYMPMEDHSLQYAMTYLEALCVHLSTVNFNHLRKQSKELLAKRNRKNNEKKEE